MIIKTYFVDRSGDHPQKEIVYIDQTGEIGVFDAHGGNAVSHIQEFLKIKTERIRLVEYDEGVAAWEVNF